MARSSARAAVNQGIMPAYAFQAARRKAALTGVKIGKARLDFEDILWLRRAATKTGAVQVPPAIAEKLISAGLVEVGSKPPTMKITEKGRIALTKLG